MASQKPLNIGLIGYGFMGRAHSTAFRQVNQFFPLDRRIVLDRRQSCLRSRGQGGYVKIADGAGKRTDRADGRVGRVVGRTKQSQFVILRKTRHRAAVDAHQVAVLCQGMASQDQDQGHDAFGDVPLAPHSICRT